MTQYQYRTKGINDVDPAFAFLLFQLVLCRQIDAKFQIWVEQGRKDRLHLFSCQGMERAKIASRCTYSRVINDLKDFGFLHYEPSLYKQRGSMISIPTKELNKEKDEGYGKERKS